MKQILTLLLGIIVTIAFVQSAISQNSMPQRTRAEITLETTRPNELKTGLDAMIARAGDKSVRVMLRLNQLAVNRTSSSPRAEASILTPLDPMRDGQTRLAAAMKASGATDIEMLKFAPIVVVTATADQLRAAAATGMVYDFEEVEYFYLHLDKSVPRIKASTAWGKNATRGKGQGQIVAVIDTGVKTSHTFLAGRLFGEACFSNTAAWCSYGSTATGSGQPCPATFSADCGHGTHVAGIALGKQTAAILSNGVAPEAKLLAIQIANAGAGGKLSIPNTNIIDALSYVAWRSQQPISLKNKSLPKIAAINMSLGSVNLYTSVCTNSVFESHIKQLADLGISTVVSTGNDSFPIGTNSPACAPSAIAVASVDNITGGGISLFSNTAPWVDLLAPGNPITSSTFNSTTSTGSASGTSQAAPHVAGAIALLRNTYGWSCDTPNKLEKDLKNTGTPRSRTWQIGGGPWQTSTHYLIDLQKIYTIKHTGPNPC
jgi:subtilisin family serine protease